MSRDKSDEWSRRDVIKALAAASVCPMVSGCEFAEVFDDEGIAESHFSVDDGGYEELADVGGKVCHDHGNRELILVRAGDDEILAFDRICPHQNLDMGPCGGNAAPASWNGDDEQIECNWHGSVFARDGSFVDGPDPDTTPDLPTFDVEFDPETGEGTVFSG